MLSTTAANLTAAILLSLLFATKPSRAAPLEFSALASHDHRVSFVPRFHPKVNWLLCDDEEIKTVPFATELRCALIEAPRDYYDEGAGNVTLRLIKLPARKPEIRRGKEVRKPIYINGGGPGGTALSIMPYLSKARSYGSDKYDAIAFDPRGLGKARPLHRCFVNESDYSEFANYTSNGVIFPGIRYLLPSGHPNETEQRARLFEQNRELAEGWTRVYAKCGSVMGSSLRYFNTASNVRDLDFLTKILYGDQTKINFYAISYGSIIGAYIANLLPRERVGLVSIDAIIDPKQWSGVPYYLTRRNPDAEKTYSDWILKLCVQAGPERCGLLAGKNDTVETIARRVDDLIDDFTLRPRNINGVFVTGTAIRGKLMWVLVSNPRGGRAQTLASLLGDAVVRQNYTSLARAVGLLDTTAGARAAIDQFSFVATVHCSDGAHFANTRNITDRSGGTIWPVPTVSDYTKNMERNLKYDSDHFATDNAFPIACSSHPATGHSPERLASNFDAALDTPMLIISNTADPITPLAAGQSLARYAGPKGGRLLIMNGPGHDTLMDGSKCIEEAKTTFFTSGRLPPVGKVCQLENALENLFPSANSTGGA